MLTVKVIVKAAIQLQIFFFIFISTGMLAWSQDKVASYKLTYKGSQSSQKLVVTTRNIGNVHLHLAEFEGQANRQEPELQDVQGAAPQTLEAINTGTTVTGWFPDPDHSGRYGAVHYPYVSERGNDDLEGFFQTPYTPYPITWSEVAIPSLSFLGEASEAPFSSDSQEATVLLPLPPINIPDPSAPGSIIQIIPEMGEVEVIAPQQPGEPHYVTGRLRREPSESDQQRQEPLSKATFSPPAEDGSVHLTSLEIPDLVRIELISPTEDHSQPPRNELMERLGSQLETFLAENEENPLPAVLTALMSTRIRPKVQVFLEGIFQEIIQQEGRLEEIIQQASHDDATPPALTEQSVEFRAEAPPEQVSEEQLKMLLQPVQQVVGYILSDVVEPRLLTELPLIVSELTAGMPETYRETMRVEAQQNLPRSDNESASTNPSQTASGNFSVAGTLITALVDACSQARDEVVARFLPQLTQQIATAMQSSLPLLPIWQEAGRGIESISVTPVAVPSVPERGYLYMYIRTDDPTDSNHEPTQTAEPPNLEDLIPGWEDELRRHLPPHSFGS